MQIRLRGFDQAAKAALLKKLWHSRCWSNRGCGYSTLGDRNRRWPDQRARRSPKSAHRFGPARLKAVQPHPKPSRWRERLRTGRSEIGAELPVLQARRAGKYCPHRRLSWLIPPFAQLVEKGTQLGRLMRQLGEEVLAPLFRGSGGQRRGRGDDTLDRARHFDRSQDRIDPAVDQRQQMPGLVNRSSRDQRRNRADAENDDRQPRPDPARSCSVIRQPIVFP